MPARPRRKRYGRTATRPSPRRCLARPVETPEVDEEAQRKIDELLNTPVDVPVEAVAPEATVKVAGTAGRVYWKWRLAGTTPEERAASLRALVHAVDAGQGPVEAITTDDVWLNKVAAAMKSGMRYPGIEVYSEGKTSFRV